MSDRGNRQKEAAKRHKAIEFRKEINQMSLIDVVAESILANIIAGLPIASICAWRCVCKLYLKLISEKWFTERYAEISPYTTILFNNDFGVHLVELAKRYCKSYKSILPRNNVKIIGSCNGLICFLYLCKKGLFDLCYHSSSYICNPVLGQYVILPESSNKENTSDGIIKDVYGFGVSLSTGHYKILRISTLISQKHPIYRKRSEAQVHTVGTNTWKSLGYLPYPSNQEILAANVEGAFHWLFYNEMKDFTSLYAFNIEEERDYQISFPPNIGKGNVIMSVRVLNNCLCLFDNSNPTQLGIWSMKEYGVGESWTLKYILTTSIPAGLDTSTLHLVAILKDDAILIKSRSGDFYIYDQKNENFTKFEIDSVDLLGDAEFNYYAIHSSNFYPPDLISTGCLIFDKVGGWHCKYHTEKV